MTDDDGVGSGRWMLDHVDARVVVIDSQGLVVAANRSWRAFEGAESSGPVGRPALDVLGDAAHARLTPMIDRARHDDGASSAEGWVVDPKHGRRYLRETVAPDRSVGAVALVVHDETAVRLQQEELAGRVAELHTSEALKSAIVDHALVALISTDADGAIVEFNPSAEAMFGWRRADAVGRRVSDVVIPERFREAHESGMRRMHRGGPARALGKRLEMHAMRADGSEFPIEMVLWRTTVAGTAFYTASIVDMTERHDAAREIERQRESLRQSEKLGAMGSLLAGVAHELNNPLAIVMGRAGILEECCDGDAPPDPAELRANARRIREAADRCGRIVRTFLDMARSRPAERRHVALNDVVRAAVDMLQYGFRSHGIVLDVSLCATLPTVMADGDRIGQIVMNLLVNAQQGLASRDGPRRVEVRTGVDGSPADAAPRVWLTVADNGAGVAPAVRTRIFEPFFTTKAAGSGTGLGLAVSRSMAREHGGDLVLEDAPCGARFRLDLPVDGHVDVAPVAVAPPRPSATLEARLLVVDDEPEVAALMRDLLEAAGYEVATAESGAVALELLDAARFDAIVSDLRMPDLDGAAFWRATGARHPDVARRMLFVTGDTLSPDAHGFLTDAGCSTLDKPFSRAELLSSVAALLR